MAFKLQRRTFLRWAMGTAAGIGGLSPYGRAVAAGNEPQPSGGQTTFPLGPQPALHARCAADLQGGVRSAARSGPATQTHSASHQRLEPGARRAEHGGRIARRRHVPQRRQDDDRGLPLHVPRTQQVRPQARIANSMRKVDDIVIESPTKATMKFNAPAPTMPQWMAFLGSYVVPKKYIKGQGLDNFLKKSGRHRTL